MSENSYQPIDELFAKIRLCVGRVRESDPAAAEELKVLLTQLEDWVESLVIDSLKLKSLESGSAAAKSPGRDRKKPARKTGGDERTIK